MKTTEKKLSNGHVVRITCLPDTFTLRWCGIVQMLEGETTRPFGYFRTKDQVISALLHGYAKTEQTRQEIRAL